MSPARPRSTTVRPRYRLALSVSIVLHAALIYGASGELWYAPEPERPRPIRLIHVTVPPPVEEFPEETPAIDEHPEPIIEELPEAPVVVAPEPVVEAPTVTPTEEPALDEGAEDGGLDYVTRSVDWDEERRRALSVLRDEGAREEGYLSFSTDDLVDEPEPVEPRPEESIFDAPPRRPSAMTPGRSRTRVGRWASRVCNELSGGGIGIFGLVSICADDSPPADYFGHLRPAYMEKVPECEEVEAAPLDFEFTGNPAALTTTKCRLVYRDDQPAMVVPEN